MGDVVVEGTVTRTIPRVRRVAIVQSNYIPWKGYFDLIGGVDLFLLYDDMQYTRRDWRNRNKIKTRDGLSWLTIPVQVKGNYYQRIRDIRVADPAWGRDHWETIRHNYAKAPYFGEVAELLQPIYLGSPETWLTDLNRRFLVAIAEYLGITTQIASSADYVLSEGKTERLVDLCLQAGAGEYLSGPSARSYIDETVFEEAGIRLRFMDYAGYPEYPQFFPPFEHGVSVIDLLCHTGPNASRFLLRDR